METAMARDAHSPQLPQELVAHMLVGQVVEVDRGTFPAPFAGPAAPIHDQLALATPFGALEMGVVSGPPGGIRLNSFPFPCLGISGLSLGSLCLRLVPQRPISLIPAPPPRRLQRLVVRDSSLYLSMGQVTLPEHLDLLTAAAALAAKELGTGARDQVRDAGPGVVAGELTLDLLVDRRIINTTRPHPPIL
jgi:hypothetical protein